MSILIAEDNEAQRRYLCDLLANEFPEFVPVLPAADGEEALELALRERPTLSILDIQMPKLSGVKAAKAIWKVFRKLASFSGLSSRTRSTSMR